MPDLTPDAIGELWLSLEDDGKLPSSGALLDHLRQQGHDISKAQVIHRLREFCGGNISDYRRDYEDGAPVVPADVTEETLRRVLREHGIDGAAAISGAWVKDGEYSIYVRMPEPDLRIDEVMDRHIKRLQAAAPAYRVPTVRISGAYTVVPQVYDLHLGKLAVDETYTLARQVEDYLRAIDGMLAFVKQRGYDVSRFIFPVGNDLMHVDTMHGTTTTGTPVESSTSPLNMFDAALEATHEAIRRLATVAPVDVVSVPGNHDYLISYCLAKALEASFARHPHVTVDAGHNPRKYRRVGPTALAFQHGHTVKAANMAGQFLMEAGELVAGARYYVVMQGHLHRQGGVYHAVTEDNGVQVRTIPALCKTDQYHLLRGYGAARAAELHLFHNEHGPAGIFPVFPHELPDTQEQADTAAPLRAVA